jgi:hypothetical protein
MPNKEKKINKKRQTCINMKVKSRQKRQEENILGDQMKQIKLTFVTKIVETIFHSDKIKSMKYPDIKSQTSGHPAHHKRMLCNIVKDERKQALKVISI